MGLPLLEDPAIRALSYPLSVTQYHLLTEGEPTELLKGAIIQKMLKSPFHTAFLGRLVEYLRRVLPDDLLVRSEGPLTTADSEPEPDVSIVPGPWDRYFKAHPTSALLVIEIAITSLAIDRPTRRPACPNTGSFNPRRA